jgi:quercetin dioxygenase-like cupin family protein
MNKKMAAASLGLLLLAGLSLAQQSVVPILPEKQLWTTPPAIPALRGAWMIGSEREPGSYALRVILTKGGKIPPHTHPDTRYSTVMSGTLYVGFGTAEDPASMVAVPAGAMYVAPANTPHYLWAKDGEVVYQEAGMGPTGTAILAVPGTGKGPPVRPL